MSGEFSGKRHCGLDPQSSRFARGIAGQARNDVSALAMQQTTSKIILFLFATLLLSSCGVRRAATLPQFSVNPIVREFQPLSETQKDSLLAIYGTNKTFVDKYLNATLIALSYFPELRYTHIEFRYSHERTTMAARPVPMSVFRRTTRYRIFINSNYNFEGIILRDIPFNAKVGLIAHELEHIADYERKNFFGIIGIAFRWMDPVRRVLFEKEIDRALVLRGLGWQLYDWATYSMFESERATEAYRQFKRDNYKNPEEIRQLIYFLSRYSHTL